MNTLPAYRTILLAAVVASTAGCASYRTSSNVDAPAGAAASATGPVLIAEDAMPSRRYTAVGPIEVSVKKLTAFHKDPTKDQANEALIEKARAMGANGVINVKYKSGVGFTTWGYIDASGTAVKLAN